MILLEIKEHHPYQALIVLGVVIFIIFLIRVFNPRDKEDR